MRLCDLPLHLRRQAEVQLSKGAKFARTEHANEHGYSLADCNAKPPTGRKKAVSCNARLGVHVFSKESSYERGFVEVLVNPREMPTAQQKGVDFKHKVFYTKPKVKAWEKALTDVFAKCSCDFKEMGFSVSQFCMDGIEVGISFFFPYNESTPKSKRIDMARMLKRPDCDNLAKGVLDSMTNGGLITDDNCIYRLTIDKYYTTDHPKIGIAIKRI